VPAVYLLMSVVLALLATLMPSPLALPKSYRFSWRLCSGVFLFAYCFRRLACVIWTMPRPSHCHVTASANQRWLPARELSWLACRLPARETTYKKIGTVSIIDDYKQSRVTTCLENLEMSGNLTAVSEMSGFFTKSRGNVGERILWGKSGLRLFIVSCMCPYRF